MQENAGNPEDPDNQRSSWFSNPGAGNTAAPVRAGIGKYIKQALDEPIGGKAATAADGGAAAAPPAAKKPKVTQQFTNFDAW